MPNLPVPYSSQWDSDAQGTQNDCGPCSIKMILNFFGENVTTDQIFKLAGAGGGLITVAQLQKAIKALGYESKWLINQAPNNIKSYIDQGIPVIPLVRYKDLQSKQDDFEGPHFMVIVGYREDGYFVNDPNFWEPLRGHGDHHFYTNTEFNNSWTNAALTGNPGNSMLVILPKKPMATETSADLKSLLEHMGVKDVVEAKAVWTKEQKNLKDDRDKRDRYKAERDEAITKLESVNIELVKVSKKSDEWDKVMTAFKDHGVSDFLSLDTYIRSIQNGSNCEELLKEEQDKHVKAMRDLKLQHEQESEGLIDLKKQPPLFQFLASFFQIVKNNKKG
jgi:hypothetical protein